MTENTVTLDPHVESSAHAHQLELEAATKANTDVHAKLQAAQEKLAELERRLDRADLSVTAKQLTDARTGVEVAERIATATKRKLDQLTGRPQLPATGLGRVLAEALAELYPIPTTLTTDKALIPEGELPQLVIACPTTSASPYGGGVVSHTGQFALVLHSRSALERHRGPEDVAEALEAIGWDVHVRETTPNVLTVRVVHGFEATPDLTAGGWMPKAGHVVETAFERLPQVLASHTYGEVNIGVDQVQLGERIKDGAAYRTVGLRLAGYTPQHIRAGLGLGQLNGTGDPSIAASLAQAASELQGLLPEFGRVTGVEVEADEPSWARRFARPLTGAWKSRAGSETHGGTAYVPVAAAYAELTVVAAA